MPAACRGACRAALIRRSYLVCRPLAGPWHSTRPIEGMDQSLKTNRALWILAEGMKQLEG